MALRASGSTGKQMKEAGAIQCCACKSVSQSAGFADLEVNVTVGTGASQGRRSFSEPTLNPIVHEICIRMLCFHMPRKVSGPR